MAAPQARHAVSQSIASCRIRKRIHPLSSVHCAPSLSNSDLSRSIASFSFIRYSSIGAAAPIGLIAPNTGVSASIGMPPGMSIGAVSQLPRGMARICVSGPVLRIENRSVSAPLPMVRDSASTPSAGS